MEKTYCIKLISNNQTIGLPYPILSNMMRINWMKYKTSVLNSGVMHISIQGFRQHYFTDGEKVLPYTKAIMLPSAVGVDVHYHNDSKEWDAVIPTDTPAGVNSITAEIFINEVHAGAQISLSNPVYLEIAFK